MCIATCPGFSWAVPLVEGTVKVSDVCRAGKNLSEIIGYDCRRLLSSAIGSFGGKDLMRLTDDNQTQDLVNQVQHLNCEKKRVAPTVFVMPLQAAPTATLPTAAAAAASASGYQPRGGSGKTASTSKLQSSFNSDFVVNWAGLGTFTVQKHA